MFITQLLAMLVLLGISVVNAVQQDYWTAYIVSAVLFLMTYVLHQINRHHPRIPNSWF